MALTVIPLHAGETPRDRRLREGFFALFGGPMAWFVQLTAGYALESESCYPGWERRVALPSALGWTRAAMVAVMLAACLTSLLALARSLRAHRISTQARQDEAAGAVRTAADRTCFLALWGIIFSAGFAVASVLTLIAFFLLPRCAG